MTLNLMMNSPQQDLKPRITVFGVGGAGGNAVNNMIEKQLEGVEFVVANTDAQALQQSRAAAKIQMGPKVTEGLGAGARPPVGAAAAEETIEAIVDHLAGAHMCFITAGMGGGTGTGAAPIIAQAARELGVLTVGVVTKPFQFEGNKRMRQAEEGIEALQKVVDTLIIIPNQNLFRLANERTTFTEAFAMADDVLYQGVKGVTDLMVRPGLINLDFADVRAVMDEMGKAMMGTGEGSGDDRAVQAAEKAIANPLLDEISLNGAKGVLINITGGYDLTLFELDEAANIIREKVDPDANIIVGSTLDPSMEGNLRVSVVATGIDASASNRAETPTRRPMGAAAPGFNAAPEQRAAEARPQVTAPAAAQVAGAAPQYVAPQPPAAQYAPQHAPQPRGQQYAEPQAPQYAQPAQPQYAPQPRAQHYAEPQHFEPQQASLPIGEPEDLRDDVPTPVYGRPQTQPVNRSFAALDQDPGAFVAPGAGRRPAGQPSDEAMSRLQAAVSKSAHRPPMAAPAAAPAAPARAQEKPRFGIGSLINRMSGHAAEPAPERAAPRQQPQAGYDDEPDLSADQERIEIPAFLRRQAN